MKMMFKNIINCGKELKEKMKKKDEKGEMVEFRDVIEK
jgi:hypothetical protein